MRTMNTMPTVRQGRTVYTGNGEGKCRAGCCMFLLVVALCGAPLAYHATEVELRSTVVSLNEVKERGVAEVRAGAAPPEEGAPLHTYGDKVEVQAAHDPAFHVLVPGATRLNRNTEYCQWQEVATEQCETCQRTVTAKDGSTTTESYSCNCYTSYTYVKGWRSHLIPSLHFDQPAAHHNPMRDPFPSQSFFADRATLFVEGDGAPATAITLGRGVIENIKAAEHRIEWELGDLQGPSEPSFFDKLFGFFSRSRARTIDLPVSLLEDTLHAPARNMDEPFVYVGQGGYFFSPHDPGMVAEMLRYFVEYLEGSLFDWQLGDIMPSCTAGDIRVSYSAQVPRDLSVLGTARGWNSADRHFELVPIHTQSKMVALLREGEMDVDDMIAAEIRDSSTAAYIGRAFMFVWALAVAALLGAAVGRDMAGLTASIGVWGLAVGGSWAQCWGVFSDWTVPTLVASTIIVLVAFMNSPAAASPGGATAVWCKLAKWARAPPEWRQQESYRPKQP